MVHFFCLLTEGKGKIVERTIIVFIELQKSDSETQKVINEKEGIAGTHWQDWKKRFGVIEAMDDRTQVQS